MNKKEQARAVYKCFCDFLDFKNFKYKGDEDGLTILLRIENDGFSASVLFSVEEENERTFIIGKLPFEIKQEKISDFIIAVNGINRVLAVGAFCVDAQKLYCGFESAETFAGISGFKADYAESIILSALSAIPEYGRLLFELNGSMPIDEFLRLL